MTEVRGLPIDYTNLGYDALRESMLAIARQTLPEWTDQTENDLGVLLIELFAYASDITLYYQSRIASQLFPATSDEPESLVQLLRLLGYELRPAPPATVDLAVAVDAAQALPLTIPAGTVFLAETVTATATATGTDDRVRFESVRDTTLTSDVLGPTIEENLRWFLPVSAVEGSTVTSELIGTSDGGPHQLHPLGQHPVIAGSITTTVTGPGGPTLWHEVRTLATAGPAERCFMVQRGADGTVTLLFGDGVNGAIPPKGSGLDQVEVHATYRVGGGPQGNVPPGTAFTSSISALRKITAPAGGSGGAVGESVVGARDLAPRLYRAQNRAVTADDYVELALRTPGVGKARAVALNWNDVLLYVAPSGRVEQPSELLRRDLLTAFESSRMAGSVLRVLGPEPADIFLQAVIRAEPFYLQDDVRAAVTAATAGLIAFDAIDFGQSLFLSRVYDVLQSLPQVASLTVTQFSRTADGGVDADGVIELEPFELARPGYPETIRLVIQGGVAR
ncbi:MULTISPECIES: baseplate J/gp47 family protein [unclassified Streptomyces]|uniref:baseplate J/gp47 family protein n=1 Tax=unclassified Streptomyces TaxID=2593676 RepID=UPI00278BB104|nr:MULTISPECIES: baseplate J/gp47 family protein [unclassified Streptomyces]